VPPGDRVRPTADRVREALFSSLQPHIAGSRVLDLYAGAGSLGLEAASRGAASVTFVERDRHVRVVLDENVSAVGVDTVDIVVGDVAHVLMRPLQYAPFDLVFADPPYDLADDMLAAVLAALVAHLAPGATVIVERSSRSAAPRWPAELHAESSRRYGDTTLHRAVMQRTAEAPRREELR
jgi:16S rRNA (guanine966-N2)-methyltransferase